MPDRPSPDRPSPDRDPANRAGENPHSNLPPLGRSPLERSPLGHLIREQIQQRVDQRITFAEFMDVALYHPQYGYYNDRARDIGPNGDFFTAPHLGADFGQLLAEQFVEMWQMLGQPQPFQLVEMGAGQGLLAQDILRHLAQHYTDCFGNLEYIIIEKAAGLIHQQRQQLESQFGDRLTLRWQTLESLADQPITGCLFSNELVDALAVHLVEFEQGKLQEVYVTVQDDRFCEILGSASSPKLEQYFEFIGVRPTGADDTGADYPDRYRTEVHLAAQDWLQSVAAGLARGYILTIDYGYTARRYYNRVRAQGTLQCYYQHRRHHDPYINVGKQDITAHVDFTHLVRWGEQCGCSTVGITSQAMFLMALGLGDRIAQLSQSESRDPQTIFDRLRQRDALHQLINPMGMGDFGVLLQAKGLTAAAFSHRLQGFDAPIPSGLFADLEAQCPQ